MKNFSLKLLLVAVLALIPLVGRSTVYEIHVDAVVTDIYGTVWDDSLTLGTPMSAVFTFDSAVSPAGTMSGWAGYLFSGLPSSITAGDYHLTSSSHSQLGIYDNNASFGEGYSFDAFDPIGIPVSYYTFMGARLWSADFSLLSSTDQPAQQIDLSNFPIRSIFFGGYTDETGTNANRQEITGQITGYHITGLASVPETLSISPAVGFLFLIAAYFRNRLLQSIKE